jgi:hypothetical protein
MGTLAARTCEAPCISIPAPSASPSAAISSANLMRLFAWLAAVAPSGRKTGFSDRWRRLSDEVPQKSCQLNRSMQHYLIS